MTATLWWGSQDTQGQGQPAGSTAAGQPADSTAGIQSLAETGEMLAVKSTSEKTGLVTFASSPGRGILLPLDAAAAADQRALSFVELYGARFGITDRSQLLLSRAQGKDEIGIEHVRFQQVHQGIPVRGGEFMVHLNGSRVTAANGLVVRDLPDNVVPNVTAGAAQDAARRLVAKYHSAAAGGLNARTAPGIFNRASSKQESMRRDSRGSSRRPTSRCASTSGWTRRPARF